jgi:hypothetical protein
MPEPTPSPTPKTQPHGYFHQAQVEDIQIADEAERALITN